MICRVCLKEPECALKIFDVNGEQLGIARILQCHFWFSPQPNDTLSTVICRVCWVKVNDFHQFYKTVEQAHMALSEQCTLAGDESVKGEHVREELLMLPELNIKEELLETVWPQATDEEDPTAVTDDSELAAVPADNVEVELGLGSKDEEAEDEDMDVGEDKGRPMNRRSRRGMKTTKRKSSKKSVKDSEAPSKPKRSVHKVITPYDDEMVKKHIAMGCDLCTFVGEDFSAISEHFRLRHCNLTPYVMCCGRKLDKRFKVVEHAHKHENPDFFRCEHCQKSFSNGYTLRNHMTAAHAPEEDLIYACDQCDKRFSRKTLLDLHKPSHIPINERKFACEKCPQSRPFASEHLLKIHICMCHKKAVNVCHVCAKEIRGNKSFEKHVRLHFEDAGPRVKCPHPNCDSWLQDKDNLRQHMRRHKEEGQIFACSECGKECKSRRALKGHIAYTHSNEVFTCEECKRTFKKAITLREHMAQHTGESLYRCPFCTRTFNSNANMHAHKKRDHPTEWDLWRKTKRGSSQKIISSRLDSSGIGST